MGDANNKLKEVIIEFAETVEREFFEIIDFISDKIKKYVSEIFNIGK